MRLLRASYQCFLVLHARKRDLRRKRLMSLGQPLTIMRPWGQDSTQRHGQADLIVHRYVVRSAKQQFYRDGVPMPT